MRGLFGMGSQHEERGSGKLGVMPARANGRFVDPESAKVVASATLAGGSAGMERLDCLGGRVGPYVGMLEGLLRHGGDFAPMGDMISNAEAAAECAIGCIEFELVGMQLRKNPAEGFRAIAIDPPEDPGFQWVRCSCRFGHDGYLAIRYARRNAIFASRKPPLRAHLAPVTAFGKFVRLIVAALVVTGVSNRLSAQEAAPDAGTARDLILKADAAYTSQRYPEAAQGYEKFLSDYGASSEAKEYLPHVRYSLSAALMQSQKFDAAAEAITEAQKTGGMSQEHRENLAFWRGVALLQAGDPVKAREALNSFMEEFPQSRRRQDAALLSATSLLAQDKFKEAAEAMRAIRNDPKSIHRGRAVVMELHSLIETGQDKAALELLAAEGTRQDRITQIATFQTLAMQLGEKLLEEEKPREAIRALQNVWSRERLIAHQQRRLADIQNRLKALEASPAPDIFEQAQARQVAREVEQELKNLEKIPSFDASVRFRMAGAFHQMERYRECALLLDDMLREMPPDNVVEQASMTALQSWMAIESYDKAVADADLFAQRFPSSKQLPLVLYLKGVAQQQSDDYEGALATFDGIIEKFPSTPQAARAQFMKGFTQLLADNNDEAAELFASFRKKHPGDELEESAVYWQGSALAFGKKFPEAREVLSMVPQKFPEGALSGPAAFRKAYSAQSMRDYEIAEQELKNYLKEFPDGEENAEARILLGDALLAQAKSDEGKEVYASVPEGAGRFHEEAQFKLARVLKLEEDNEGLRALMQQFLAQYPNSPRAAEALFLIGQAWRQEDRQDKAIEEYWKAIKKFGNDPDAYSVEDLFLALGRLYRGDSEKQDYLAELRSLRQQAEVGGQKILAVRAIWALAQAVKKSDPSLSQSLLREASVLADASVTNPAVLADCAEAQMQSAERQSDPVESARRQELATSIYRNLLKWHPRAPQKDKALGVLAKLALAKNDTQTALDYYARIERDTPWSPLMGEVLMTRAQFEIGKGRLDEAVDSYTRLLAAENVSGKTKAEALLALGELEMQRDRPKAAIPYYQRIYILYGKWRNAVAKAYLRSGEAFEKIDDLEAARKTYEELVNSEDLASMPEAAQARENLKKFPQSKEASS